MACGARLRVRGRSGAELRPDVRARRRSSAVQFGRTCRAGCRPGLAWRAALAGGRVSRGARSAGARRGVLRGVPSSWVRGQARPTSPCGARLELCSAPRSDSLGGCCARRTSPWLRAAGAAAFPGIAIGEAWHGLTRIADSTPAAIGGLRRSLARRCSYCSRVGGFPPGRLACWPRGSPRRSRRPSMRSTARPREAGRRRRRRPPQSRRRAP